MKTEHRWYERWYERWGGRLGTRVGLAALAALLAAPLAAPLPLLAQDSGGARTRVWRQGDRVPATREYLSIVMGRRARLGIQVSLQARASDSLGAYVDAVTPGGPAAKAGIRSGDVITRLDGTPLVQREGRGDAAGRSLPGLKLVELAAQLAPNDTVTVELRRGQGWKDRKTVRVVTESEPGTFAMRGGPDRPFLFRFGPDDEPGFPPAYFFGSALGQLELAPMNPDLGQYFGTDDGVLVVSAPKNGKLNLKGGDVILAVDGRKVASPSHLLRILRSYEPGETFRLDIQRNRHRETVTGSLDDTGPRGDLPRRSPAPGGSPM
ncbi:MAG TPA: PDZ domain-containing protein [Gemmatimonadales bacterium]|nr:PDZ domain-containing protein [Gemmatimonadales bacterium]